MDTNSIFARIATGFATKAIAAGLAIWVAHTAWTYVAHVFATVNTALPH